MDNIKLSNVYGTKSILLEQYPDSAWEWVSGRDEDQAGIRAMSENVPWLFRGIRAIVQGAAEVPVCLVKGETDIGYLGEEFDSPFLYIQDLPILIKKIAASITLEGRSYLFREKIKGSDVAKSTKKLWYWNPMTVTFDAQKTAREIGKERLLYFKRVAPGVSQQEYTNKEVIYFWPDDAYVEVGPPLGSPAKAALAAAGVLFNIDKYVSTYFEKGAVRAYLFSKQGSPPSEEDQDKFFKKINNAVMGLRNAFRGIFISDLVKTEKIGDGLEGLQKTELTKEKREDISTALGIPQSILWSTESGGLGGAGVATEDTYRFYRMNIVPSVRFICDVLNKQHFNASGYRLEVRENDMDVFQEDENARSASLSSLTTSLEKPEEFLIAAGILGYDLPEDTIKEIEELGAQRKEAAAQIQNNITNSKPEEKPSEKPIDEEVDEAPEDKRLATWRRYTLKHGKSSVSKFDTNGINPETVTRVIKLVGLSTNNDEIKAAFDIVKPNVSEVNTILEAMRIEMNGIKNTSQSNVIIDTTGRHLEEIEVKNMKRNEDVVSAINVMANRLDKQIVIPAPVVNVTTPETVVNVPAPVVTVNVEKPDAPIVNIEPAQVQVNTPKIKRSKQKVTKDNDGRVIGSETEYEY